MRCIELRAVDAAKPSFQVINNTDALRIIHDSVLTAGVSISASLDEPIAIACHYSRINFNLNAVFLVVDIGGGTCDVSLVELRNNVRAYDLISASPE